MRLLDPEMSLRRLAGRVQSPDEPSGYVGPLQLERVRHSNTRLPISLCRVLVVPGEDRDLWKRYGTIASLVRVGLIEWCTLRQSQRSQQSKQSVIHVRVTVCVET